MRIPPAKNLLWVGSGALTLGIPLFMWVDLAANAPLAGLIFVEGLASLFLIMGLLALSAGGIGFALKANSKQVLFVGALVGGIALVGVPVLSALLHFEANVHGWTGLLFFFIWIPACVIGSLCLLSGSIRRLRRR
jgi:hypothetical protein